MAAEIAEAEAEMAELEAAEAAAELEAAGTEEPGGGDSDGGGGDGSNSGVDGDASTGGRRMSDGSGLGLRYESLLDELRGSSGFKTQKQRKSMAPVGQAAAQQLQQPPEKGQESAEDAAMRAEIQLAAREWGAVQIQKLGRGALGKGRWFAELERQEGQLADGAAGKLSPHLCAACARVPVCVPPRCGADICRGFTDEAAAEAEAEAARGQFRAAVKIQAIRRGKIGSAMFMAEMDRQEQEIMDELAEAEEEEGLEDETF
jgi:hypothetical protein